MRNGKMSHPVVLITGALSGIGRASGPLSTASHAGSRAQAARKAVIQRLHNLAATRALAVKHQAVLVEAGFLSNPQEAKKLKNPNYLKFLSWSIAKGIEDFIAKEKL